MGVLERYQKRKTENNTSGGVMARYEKRKEYESLGVDQVNNDYISSFASDANTFFGQFKDGNEPTYTDAGKTLSDLDTRYQTISGWLDKNKSLLDEKAYSDFSASLSDFNSFFFPPTP